MTWGPDLRARVRYIGGVGLLYFGMPERSDNGLYKGDPDIYTSSWLTHNTHLPIMPEYSCTSLHGCLLMLRTMDLIEIVNVEVRCDLENYNYLRVVFWYTTLGAHWLIEAMDQDRY